ncbi:MAG: CdaR family protein [Chlamydiales bacterium]|nr:CdaR family protein [Chlamydiales bacterium]
MDGVVTKVFVLDWQRKLVALIGAIAVWLFVHQSITETKTLANVPIRLINLTSDKTVHGLLPNGLLNKRVALTITGTKDVIDNLESSDLEVVLDAATLPDEWVLQVSKKNLVSLDPEIDLTHHVSSVTNSEFVIKMSKVITERIPVTIASPIGSAPEGYQFLDISPQTLTHTITGPEDLVRQLQERGFSLEFDLNQISKAQLDDLKGSDISYRQDEVQFPVPDRWKLIVVPGESDMPELINDPAAKNLVITFLRKELLPIPSEIPARVFYPAEYINTLNPLTHSLAIAGAIKEKDGVRFLGIPLLAGDVSRVFLDIVKDNLELVIVAAPAQEREFLQWSVEFVNERELEDTFVALLMSDRTESVNPQKKESRLRRRFREYMQNMAVYKEKGQKLLLEAKVQENSIVLNDVSGSF